MSTNNFVKFMTEELVKYFNLTKEERKRRRKMEKETHSILLNRWLGILPFSLRLFWKGK